MLFSFCGYIKQYHIDPFYLFNLKDSGWNGSLGYRAEKVTELCMSLEIHSKATEKNQIWCRAFFSMSCENVHSLLCFYFLNVWIHLFFLFSPWQSSKYQTRFQRCQHSSRSKEDTIFVVGESTFIVEPKAKKLCLPSFTKYHLLLNVCIEKRNNYL